jgi:hypothetical protein
VGVLEHLAVSTVFHCASTERLNGKATRHGIESFDNIGTSKNVLCSAMLVDANNSPPTSMVMLPVSRSAKPGGM